MSERMEPDSELDRAVADILSNLSEVRVEEALAGINTLSQRIGGAPIVFHLVGLASLRLNEPGKAVEALLAAHEAEPDIREYSGALSIVMSKVGRLVDSLFYQKLSIAATREAGFPGLVPDWLGNFAEEFQNIAEAPLLRAANAAFARGDYAAAATSFKQECEVDPGSVSAWRGLALAALLDGKPFRAVAAAERLVALEPGEAEHHALLGRCLAHTARFDEAMAAHRRAELLAPADADLAWQTIATAAQRPGIALPELTGIMTRWGQHFTPARAAAPEPRDLTMRRLRVGIVSSHWGEGEGLDTLVPVLELLDRRRIELFCYAAGLTGAALAVRMRQRSNHWCDLQDLDDATAEIVVRNDDLDLLIDLDGPTRSARPGLVAARPAALGFSVYGIAEAAQALGFDGVIGGESAYPAGAPGTVIRVPGGLAALPSSLTPLSRPPRDDRPTVFGSLAYRWQIGPETVAAWAALLAAAPGTVLALNLERLGGLEAAHDLAGRYAGLLPRDRVLTSNADAALTDYLLSVDVLLDPIGNPHPDEGLAAVALGVPIVTCRSILPRTALLATWLDTAGLGDLVAGDRDEYVEVAARFAAAGERSALIDRVTAAATAEMSAGAMRQSAKLGAALFAAASGTAA
jgi:protein O-GlcNAc transferase